jgi:hypothetical protein
MWAFIKKRGVKVIRIWGRYIYPSGVRIRARTSKHVDKAYKGMKPFGDGIKRLSFGARDGDGYKSTAIVYQEGISDR